MPLIVYTARISTRDPDRFDITRKSGGDLGLPFAPSWTILGPALEARRKSERLGQGPWNEDADGADAEQAHDDAREILDAAWALYVPAYLAEMRISYRRLRPAWSALLARPRVVLVCYCTDAARCHRTLLAGILGKLGADVRGELPA